MTRLVKFVKSCVRELATIPCSLAPPWLWELLPTFLVRMAVPVCSEWIIWGFEFLGLAVPWGARADTSLWRSPLASATFSTASIRKVKEKYIFSQGGRGIQTYEEICQVRGWLKRQWKRNSQDTQNEESDFIKIVCKSPCEVVQPSTSNKSNPWGQRKSDFKN